MPRIKNPSFEDGELENGLPVHISYTTEEDGGAASGYNRSIIMKRKSTETNTEHKKQNLQIVMGYEQIERYLLEALKDQFIKNYCFIKIINFDDECVFYGVGNDEINVLEEDSDAMYYVCEYEIDQDTNRVTFKGIQEQVIPTVSYTFDNGNSLVINESSMPNKKTSSSIKKMAKNEDTLNVLRELVIKDKKKLFHGKTYSSEDFAYVPDENKPSTWKLPIFDEEHAKLALQAISSKGLMGSKAKIPADQIPAIRRKIKNILNKYEKEKSMSDKDVSELKKQLQDEISSHEETKKELELLKKASETPEQVMKSLEESKDPKDKLILELTKAHQKLLDDVAKEKESFLKSEINSKLESIGLGGKEELVEAIFKSSNNQVIMNTLFEVCKKSDESILTQELGFSTTDSKNSEAIQKSSSTNNDFISNIAKHYNNMKEVAK